MEKQNYECRKEFEEDLKGVKSSCCNEELISNSLGETICSNCGNEEEGNIITCKDCNKNFNSNLEGSTDEPDLCDSCWNKVYNTYVNIIMINLEKAGDFREVLEYINEDLYQNLSTLDEMANNCHEFLKGLTIKELKNLIYERPDLLSMKNYLTEDREKDYLKERRERDVFFNKDTKEIYCEYLDELSDREEREETKKELAQENEISIEKIGFVRFSRNPLIYQH